MIQAIKQEKLGTLLALIFKLQNETSFPDEKQRQETLNRLVIYAQQIGLTLDPNDPDFLPTLLIKVLEESLKPTELPPGNLPPQELTEIYEKEKQEKEAQIKEAIGSQKNYSDYHNYIELFKQWVLKNKPQLPDQLATAIAEESVQKTIASFEPIAQPNVLSEEDKNKILEQAEKIVRDELKKIELADKTVISKTEKTIGKEPQKITGIQPLPTLRESKGTTIPTKGITPPIKPVKKEKVATKEPQKITGIQPLFVPKEFKEIIKAQSVKIAANPQIIRPLQETVKTKTIPYREIPLPDNIIKKLEQPPEEITFLPLYTLLHPKVLATWVEKKLYTIPAKILKIGTEETTPEWQAMAQQGLFTKDYQNSIKTLKDWGTSIDHPLLKKLEDKAEHFKEQQKATYKIKKGISLIQSWRDTAAAKILKHYYHFDKITGRHKIYDKDLKANLPKLSPDPIWSQGGYAGFLKNTLDRFRFAIRGYEKISKFVTKGKHTSFLVPVKKFFSQKVTQPIVRWLAKTAAGKAVKAGVKKAAGWLATKLGVKIAVKAGIAAAGAASGPPGWVIAVATFAIDILKFLGKKAVGFIQRIIRDPEKALLSVGAGILMLVFIPMPIALIAVAPIAIGGIGITSFILAPTTLITIGGGIGTFFTSLTALSFALPVTLFIVTLLAVLAGLTLFVVLVVSGAFILPSQVAEVTPITTSPYVSEYFELKKIASVNHLENNQLPAKITYTITIKPKNNYVLKLNQINEQITVSKKNSTPQLEPCKFEELPTIIEKTETLICEKTFNNDFTDSAVINTVSLLISIEGEKGIQKGITSATVTIGEPPGECPSGWPINPNEAPGAYISQGPTTTGSHQGDEAIDIAIGNNTPVYATHEGKVTRIFYDGGGGRTIEITGVCEGVEFKSKYLHLNAYLVSVGETVTKGSLIALSDNSGSHTTGAHLDYRFSGLLMEPPYIPVDVRGCRGNRINPCYSF